jgi:hypothetical protein
VGLFIEKRGETVGSFASGVEFSEKGNRVSLYYRGKRLPVSIERDKKHPVMWRVRLPDGLTDMVNKARAMDAAITYAERLARPLEAPDSLSEAPSRRLNARSDPHPRTSL